MELRFNIKKEDAERAAELAQQIRNPAGSIHAQVEYPVLRVVVNDLNNVDLTALAKQIEGSLSTPTQPADYVEESEFADLQRRAGIIEGTEHLDHRYIPQAIQTAKADIGSIVSFLEKGILVPGMKGGDASDITASLKQTMGDLDDALEVLKRGQQS